jgi:hypothetical protein
MLRLRVKPPPAVSPLDFPRHDTLDSEKFKTKKPELFKGTTIICHLDQRGELFRALIEDFRFLVGFKFSARASLLPTSSYHMTVASCSDRHLVPGNLGIQDGESDEMSAAVHKKLKEELCVDDVEFPIRVKADEIIIMGAASMNLIVRPVDEKEKAKLNKVRERVARILGFGFDPNPTLHVTIAYFVDEFTEDEKREFNENIHHLNDIVRGKVAEFDKVEFCYFKDMFEYVPVEIFK